MQRFALQAALPGTDYVVDVWLDRVISSCGQGSYVRELIRRNWGAADGTNLY